METATEKLGGLDVVTMSSDFSDTNAEIQNFLKEFSEAYAPLGPSLTETSVEAKSAFAEIAEVSSRLKKMLDPSSDFRFGFSDTLREIAAMAKSLKRLADLLERNPKPSSGANQNHKNENICGNLLFSFPFGLAFCLLRNSRIQPYRTDLPPSFGTSIGP